MDIKKDAWGPLWIGIWHRSKWSYFSKQIPFFTPESSALELIKKHLKWIERELDMPSRMRGSSHNFICSAKDKFCCLDLRKNRLTYLRWFIFHSLQLWDPQVCSSSSFRELYCQLYVNFIHFIYTWYSARPLPSKTELWEVLRKR